MTMIPNANVGSTAAQNDAQVAALATQFFTGISSARPSLDANYCRPFAGLIRLNKVKLGVSRKKEGYMVFEMTALEVFDPKIASQTPGKQPVHVGEEISHMLMIKHEPFLSNVVSFLVGLGLATEAELKGQPDQQIINNYIVPICIAAQPLADTILEVDVDYRTSQKNNIYTKLSWKGEVNPVAALARLKPETQSRFWPDNKLRVKAANWANAMAAAGQPVDPNLLRQVGLIQ